MGWLTPRPGRFTPGKTPHPLYRRLGGSQGRVRIISPPPGLDPRTVQPVASRYTDWAIPPPPPHYLFTFLIFYIFSSFTGQYNFFFNF